MKLFRMEEKDEAWRYAWAARDAGEIGFAFVYASPPQVGASAPQQPGFGDIFGALSGSPSIRKPDPEPKRWGSLIAVWPENTGLTDLGHRAIAAKFTIVGFTQCDYLILSLDDESIEDAVDRVREGSGVHRGHMMPPKPPR